MTAPERARRPIPLSLKGRALKYLAAREHSRSELMRKLAAHAEDRAEIERVLDELAERGFLSEERFVESLIHRRAASHGAARIRQELGAKGIAPSDDVREQLQRLATTDLDRATQLWRRRFGTLPQAPREQARQMRFLLSRGFSGEVVRRVLKGVDLPGDDDGSDDID